MDSTLMDTLNELYELVCRAGITRLKPGTMLSSLLSCEEELEARRKQKYENIIEDMRSVSGCAVFPSHCMACLEWCCTTPLFNLLHVYTFHVVFYKNATKPLNPFDLLIEHLHMIGRVFSQNGRVEWCLSKDQRDFEVLLHSLYHIKGKAKKWSRGYTVLFHSLMRTLAQPSWNFQH